MLSPVFASVAFFDVVVWLHITAALVAFGPPFAFGVLIATAESLDPRSLPTIGRAVDRITSKMMMSAAVVVLATGIYLTIDRFSFSDVFVTVGLTVVIGLIVLHFAFFSPKTKSLIALAERDVGADGRGELSEEYRSVSKSVGIVSIAASLAVVLTIYFMTAKPFL